MPGPRFLSGDPPRGSTLMTVAPRSARSPPANSPARVSAISTTRSPSSAPPRSESGSSIGMVSASLEPEDARGIRVEPLLLDRVLQRQAHVLEDQRLVRLADQSRRQAHEHLVLDERVAELDEHLPA